MKWYKKIGKELNGVYPELDVVEFPTADTPDSILFQGIWTTEKGEFFMEYEGHCKLNKICWLRISEWSNGSEVIAEFTDIIKFAKSYPNCYQEMQTFLIENQI
jgi:hypothetical protein